MAATHNGECFCGAIHVEVSGEPEAMGYCHCQSCRSWSAAPVTAFTLWKPDAVRVTAGAEHVATFQKTKFSQRQYCKKCGGHLMNNHPTIGLVDVYAATIPTLRFSAGVHINYADTVLPIRDGTPQAEGFSPKSLAAQAKACRSERGAKALGTTAEMTWPLADNPTPPAFVRSWHLADIDADANNVRS